MVVMQGRLLHAPQPGPEPEIAKLIVEPIIDPSHVAPLLQCRHRWKDWRIHMLETIAIILIVLWLLGMVSGYTLGNFIYVLLVVAIVLFLVRLISGRRVV
jgi:uncharacterized protein DUF5670